MWLADPEEVNSVLKPVIEGAAYSLEEKHSYLILSSAARTVLQSRMYSIRVYVNYAN